MKIFLDDRLLPEPEAMVSVFDHGFLYGDGIYETMRAYDGKVFMLQRHIERLNRSASLIRLTVPAPEAIRDAVYETIRDNGLRNAYVRVTVSRGRGPIGLDPALCPKPTFVVIAQEFREYPENHYSEGVKLILAQTRRNLKEAINPKIKSLNFLNNILARIEAKERGAYEAVMLNAQGFISEGTICNIFFVRDDILCTPSVDTGLLDGITRGVVIGIADETGMQVKEGNFRPKDLFSASEVFLTNTTAEVMPVCRVEDVTYAVGDVARRLRRLYREKVLMALKGDG